MESLKDYLSRRGGVGEGREEEGRGRRGGGCGSECG